MLILAERTIDPGITVLQATGRITLGRNSQELEWKVDDLLKQKPLRMVLDLTQVEHLDSTGIGIIVMAAGKISDSGGHLRIAGAKGTVEHTLQLCKVCDIVPLCANVEEAVTSLGRAAGAA